MTTTANQRQVLPTDTRDEVAEHLQNALIGLIDLALQGKQAHWNLRGPSFRAVHLHLDEIIDLVRDSSDEVAERISALGVAADGRASTVATNSELETFPGGIVTVQEAIRLISDQMKTCSASLRSHISAIGDNDPISEDLLIGICGKLEKQLWMLESQSEDAVS